MGSMKKARIVFMGTPAFAVPSLEALIQDGHEVVAVVTAPDRPAGRGRLPRASEVKQRALEWRLPVLQPERLKDPTFLDELNGLHADLFIVVAFRMLPEVVWAMPHLGTINLHGSLLPQYRGAAPINWAIINGEEGTGITTFRIGATIDTGDILLQEPLSIGPDETAGELHDRMMMAGARLLTRTVRGLLDGTLHSTPQPRITSLRPAPKLHGTTGHIDPNVPAQRIHDLVRGLAPYPGAWARLVPEGSPPWHFKVLRAARATTEGAGTAGEVHVFDGRLFLRCADAWLELLEVQVEGRRRMSGAELARGQHARSIGTLLGRIE